MPQFVKLWEQGYEVVYGTKQERDEPWLMTTLREAYYVLLTSMSTLRLPRNLSDYQLLDKRVLDAMRQYDDAYPFVRVWPSSVPPTPSASLPVERTPKRNLEKPDGEFNRSGLNGIISTTHVPTRIAFLRRVYFPLQYYLCDDQYRVFVDRTADRRQHGHPHPDRGHVLFQRHYSVFLGILGEYILAIHQQVRRQPRVVEHDGLILINRRRSNPYSQ